MSDFDPMQAIKLAMMNVERAARKAAAMARAVENIQRHTLQTDPKPDQQKTPPD